MRRKRQLDEKKKFIQRFWRKNGITKKVKFWIYKIAFTFGMNFNSHAAA